MWGIVRSPHYAPPDIVALCPVRALKFLTGLELYCFGSCLHQATDFYRDDSINIRNAFSERLVANTRGTPFGVRRFAIHSFLWWLVAQREMIQTLYVVLLPPHRTRFDGENCYNEQMRTVFHVV